MLDPPQPETARPLVRKERCNQAQCTCPPDRSNPREESIEMHNGLFVKNFCEDRSIVTQARRMMPIYWKYRTKYGLRNNKSSGTAFRYAAKPPVRRPAFGLKNFISNVVPSPTLLLTDTSPPCSFITFSTIASPKPVLCGTAGSPVLFSKI